MTYEEAKTAPLNKLLEWLFRPSNEQYCRTQCQTEHTNTCPILGKFIITCPQRIAYERVMDAVMKQAVRANWFAYENEMYSPFESGSDPYRYVCSNCGAKSSRARKRCDKCDALMGEVIHGAAD